MVEDLPAFPESKCREEPQSAPRAYSQNRLPWARHGFVPPEAAAGRATPIAAPVSAGWVVPARPRDFPPRGPVIGRVARSATPGQKLGFLSGVDIRAQATTASVTSTSPVTPVGRLPQQTAEAVAPIQEILQLLRPIFGGVLIAKKHWTCKAVP